MKEPRAVLADNAGLFALGGTRTFLVGRTKVAVVDPGPGASAHLDALVQEVEGAREGVILLTHRHPDHAAGAPELARRTGFGVRAGPVDGWPEARRMDAGQKEEAHVEGAGPESGGHPASGPLSGGDEIPTDDGPVQVVPTPGHARDHAAFFLPGSGILLAGDLLLGKGSTAWVGEYAGCVADYLASLDRIEALAPRRILPAHGPPLDDPADAIRRFREHRLARIEEVARALERLGDVAGGPGSEEGVERLVDLVYGATLAPGLRTAAAWSIRAILEHLGAAPFPAGGAPTEGGDAGFSTEDGTG